MGGWLGRWVGELMSKRASKQRMRLHSFVRHGSTAIRFLCNMSQQAGIGKASK